MDLGVRERGGCRLNIVVLSWMSIIGGSTDVANWSFV